MLRHVGKPGLDQHLHLPAWDRRPIAKIQQRHDVMQREPRGLGRSDEPKPLYRFLAVEPIVARGPTRRPKKTRSFVVTHRRGRDASLLGQRADGESLGQGHTPSNKIEPWFNVSVEGTIRSKFDALMGHHPPAARGVKTGPPTNQFAQPAGEQFLTEQT